MKNNCALYQYLYEREGEDNLESENRVDNSWNLNIEGKKYKIDYAQSTIVTGRKFLILDYGGIKNRSSLHCIACLTLKSKDTSFPEVILQPRAVALKRSCFSESFVEPNPITTERESLRFPLVAKVEQ